MCNNILFKKKQQNIGGAEDHSVTYNFSRDLF